MSMEDRGGFEGSVGPFATFVDHVRPDGVARWESRSHRKYPGTLATGSGWWAPRAGCLAVEAASLVSSDARD